MGDYQKEVVALAEKLLAAAREEEFENSTIAEILYELHELVIERD